MSNAHSLENAVKLYEKFQHELRSYKIAAKN
jgi:hypothetical protein